MAKRRRKNTSIPRSLWDKVRLKYELGTVSIRSIADEFGISEAAIRKRAKAEGWTPQFAMHVEARRRALMLPVVIEQVRASGTQPPEPDAAQAEAIDDAARTQMAVILGHRKRYRETLTIADAMLDELKGQTLNVGTIEEMINLHFAGGGDVGASIRQGLHQSLKLAGRAGTLTKLVDALGKLSTLERQAFGMGNLESDPPGDPVRKEQEAVAAGEFDGVTDDERARALLSLIEKAARAKAAEPKPTAPGTETTQ